MSRAALFVAAFAAALLAIALVAIATIRPGGEVEVTAAAVIGLALAAVPGPFLVARTTSETARRGWLLVAAGAAAFAPIVASEAGSIGLFYSSWERSLSALPPFALVVALLCGALLLPAIVATFALATDAAIRTSRADPTAWLALGVASAFACAPVLLFDSPGAIGSSKLATALFACALALRIAAGHASDPAVGPPTETVRLRERLLAGAIGLFCGRGLAWIGARLLETPGAILGGCAALIASLGVATIASRFTGSRRLDPNRLLALLPIFVASAAIGRVLPRPPDSTRDALLLLGGVSVVAFAYWLPPVRRSLALVLGAAGVILTAIAARSRPFQGDGCEADGAHYSVRALEDGRLVPWIAGAPLETLEIGSHAAARAVGLALCLVEEPRRSLVIGAGGARFARALETATEGSVTWVTPLTHEARLESDPAPSRIRIVPARERAFVELDRETWDLVILAPPTREPSRFGRLLTREFTNLLLSRLSSTGMACQIFNVGATAPVQLIQQLLPTMGFSPYRCFVDHPANPSPLLLRVSGPGARGPLPDRIEARFPVVVGRLPALSEADLDSLSLLQNYLFDDSILDYWYDESWFNDDACPRLVARFGPRFESTKESRAAILRSLLDKRTSIGEPFRALAPDDPDFSARYAKIQDRLRKDHEAVEFVVGRAIRNASTGATRLNPGAIPTTDDLPSLTSAVTASPDLSLVRRPLDRALGAALDRRDYETASGILSTLTVIQPERFDVRLRLAEMYSRRGHVKWAESTYRSILALDPTHHAATVNLAILLSGFADDARRAEARERLRGTLPATATDPGRIEPVSHGIAVTLLKALDGDLAGARESAAALPPHVRSLALFRVLDLPRRGRP